MTTQLTVNYSTWALRGDDQADWYESYANRAVFELCDAASILANVQPEYPRQTGLRACRSYQPVGREAERERARSARPWWIQPRQPASSSLVAPEAKKLVR